MSWAVLLLNSYISPSTAPITGALAQPTDQTLKRTIHCVTNRLSVCMGLVDEGLFRRSCDFENTAGPRASRACRSLSEWPLTTDSFPAPREYFSLCVFNVPCVVACRTPVFTVAYETINRLSPPLMTFFCAFEQHAILLLAVSSLFSTRHALNKFCLWLSIVETEVTPLRAARSPRYHGMTEVDA